jgi:hypothetical protein
MTTATLTRQTKKLKKSTKLATEKLQKPERKTPYERRPDLCQRVTEGDRKAALKLSKLFFEYQERFIRLPGWTLTQMLAESLALRAIGGDSMTLSRWFRIEMRAKGPLVRSEGMGFSNWKRIAYAMHGSDIWEAVDYVAKLILETFREEHELGLCAMTS